MKVFKILIVVVVLGALVISLLACGSEEDEAAPEIETAVVQRGDLTIDITAAGNLALSLMEDLPIDLFYQEGTIEEVLVEEGDTVEQGQVLVKLDTDEWEDELSTLEDLVTAKERALVQAKINLQTAEQNLKNSRDNEATREQAVLSARINLQQAQDNLAAGIAAVDFAAANAELNKAKAWYDYVNTTLKESDIDLDDWLLALEQAQERLDVAQADYDNALAGYDSQEIDLKKKQVQVAEMSLAAAQEDLNEVDTDIALKELQLTLSQGNLQDAEKALADADKDLEAARSKSPEITAPFDGFITKVNVEGGDEVMKGTVAVQLADPTKFEADILVSEMDILQVELGGQAWVAVDAMQGMSFPATVTHIAPTATIQSGVVNYVVKVEIKSLEAVSQELQDMRQQIMADIAAGELPPPLQQAVDEGRLTEEQAKQMMEQGPPEGFTPPEGMEFPAMSGTAAQGQLPSAVPENFQLREGLTVTVSIIITESTDVLLVPNAAISVDGGQSYVQVIQPSGDTEKRAVETGISDYQFTEITDGLSEGEEIIVPQGTVATTTSSQSSGPRMGFFGPPPR